MADTISRRRLIELGLAAGGAAALSTRAAAAPNQGTPPMPNPMYPEHYLKVLGFFEEQDSNWYETVHVPDFMSFAAPHMDRYARNWIRQVEAGETPAFRVITEIQYRNDAAKRAVRDLMSSPAGQPLLTHSLEHRAARGAPTSATAEPLRLFSVEPRALSRRVVGGGPKTMQRRVLLLRRSSEASRSAFAAAAMTLARTTAHGGGEASLDVFGANAQPGPADAVIYVANPGSGPAPASTDPALRVLSVLRVETRSSVG
jgi:hypothetical protein